MQAASGASEGANPDEPVTAEQRQWRKDAQVLARIGEVLADVPMPTVEVWLPNDLARAALAAWARDDLTGPSNESLAQRQDRVRAGYLALIGLCIEQVGHVEADGVVVPLSAGFVWAAMEAAEESDRDE